MNVTLLTKNCVTIYGTSVVLIIMCATHYKQCWTPYTLRRFLSPFSSFIVLVIAVVVSCLSNILIALFCSYNIFVKQPKQSIVRNESELRSYGFITSSMLFCRLRNCKVKFIWQTVTRKKPDLSRQKNSKLPYFHLNDLHLLRRRDFKQIGMEKTSSI